MYEKYPWRGRPPGRLVGINARRADFSISLSLVGIAGILESIVLMGLLSSTAGLICIQPRAAHPRNSFYEEGIMTPPKRLP